MAPSLIETTYEPVRTYTKTLRAETPTKDDELTYEPGRTAVEEHVEYEHQDLLPRFPDLRWDALTEVPYSDKGLNGHPQFKNLLDAATDVFDYNPKIGTEIDGINLANLTHAQKDDLARLISIRGVVFFRNQLDFNIDAQRKLGQYFGKLHKHSTTAVPRRIGLEDVHVVYTDENSKDQRAFFTPTFLWHSDVSLPLILSASLKAKDESRLVMKFNHHLTRP